MTLSYDPAMRLYENASGTQTSRWLWDGWDLVGEYNAAGGVASRLVRGPGGEIVALVANGTRYWAHQDERGSVIRGSKSDGTADIPQPTAYDEYGRKSGANSIYGIGGERYIRFTDLVYLRHRVYNPSDGRFMQADPIGYGAGMNMYAYVKGDPVNFVDPMGLCGFRGWAHFEAPQGPDGNPSGPWKHTGNTWESFGDCGGMSARFRYDAPIEPGGGGGSVDDGVKLGKMCKGSAEFTAVGGNQAMAEGALARFGLSPKPGTVAVDPNQFGIRYGGTASFNEAAQRQFAPIAKQIGIISPAAAALSAQYGGPTSSFFSISDIGDKNVRSGDILRLDLYRFPTESQARGFGREILPVIITNLPLNMPCPPGTTEM